MQFVRLIVIVFVVLLSALLPVDGVNRRVKMCLQASQSGRCFGYVPSFAYNPIARKCEAFIYGGCGGNDNRFDTKMQCEFSCRDI